MPTRTQQVGIFLALSIVALFALARAL